MSLTWPPLEFITKICALSFNIGAKASRSVITHQEPAIPSSQYPYQQIQTTPVFTAKTEVQMAKESE
jgi:hypothetical protein